MHGDGISATAQWSLTSRSSRPSEARPYAVTTGSIGSRDIKDNTIRGKDIKRATVKGSDVAADALDGADIAEATLAEVPRSGDSGLLDGLDSTAFLGTGAKAADAELLDGRDSSAFVEGPLQAAVASESSATIEPGPESQTTSVTLPNSAPRRYAVWATQKLTFTCFGNGPCHADFGLYANDAPLEGSGRRFADAEGGGSDTQQLVMFGLTPVLPAGPVNIRVGRSDSSGTFSSAARAGQIMAVALDG